MNKWSKKRDIELTVSYINNCKNKNYKIRMYKKTMLYKIKNMKQNPANQCSLQIRNIKVVCSDSRVFIDLETITSCCCSRCSFELKLISSDLLFLHRVIIFKPVILRSQSKFSYSDCSSMSSNWYVLRSCDDGLWMTSLLLCDEFREEVESFGSCTDFGIFINLL